MAAPTVSPAQADPLRLSRTLRVGRIEAGSAEEKRLRELWKARPGWRGWFSTVDHKTIGLRYLVTAFLFLLAGGIEALLMRLQLALAFDSPGYLPPHHYDQIFTAHGVIMIFFMVMPAMIGGFGNWFVPIMIGAPDMAFPRMNNISFWLLVPSFLLLLLLLLLLPL